MERRLIMKYISTADVGLGAGQGMYHSLIPRCYGLLCCVPKIGLYLVNRRACSTMKPPLFSFLGMGSSVFTSMFLEVFIV